MYAMAHHHGGKVPGGLTLKGDPAPALPSNLLSKEVHPATAYGKGSAVRSHA